MDVSVTKCNDQVKSSETASWYYSYVAGRAYGATERMFSMYTGRTRFWRVAVDCAMYLEDNPEGNVRAFWKGWEDAREVGTWA